jgi:hypothetical protein
MVNLNTTLVVFYRNGALGNRIRPHIMLPHTAETEKDLDVDIGEYNMLYFERERIEDT